MEQHLRGSQSPIDVFKYRRRRLSPLAPLQNLIAPQTEDGVSAAGSYGSKGQFVHGKENLRPTSFPAKNKSEAQMCKSTTSSGLCTPSPKSHVAHQVMASAVTEAAAAALTSSPKPNNTSETPITVISCKDWSPQDDGIEVILPPTELPSSNEDVDASSTAGLSLVYGPTTRRRLPLFAEICPE
ncbi:uncharacterized protein LOC133745991 [Rosa rugosa]|uniref:uncharacterized protein LOC133745991 n=1 Tax=Rosa rugosa TaxID=74645 RepID=UPI002B403BE5|nr:uncharacterized protein LOC133745991 [Rosa rugosa]